MKSKEQKREEAKARQHKYDMLSTKEKLAKLNRSSLTAHNERSKLAELIAKDTEKETVAKKSKPKKDGRSSKAITKKELKAAKKATKSL